MGQLSAAKHIELNSLAGVNAKVLDAELAATREQKQLAELRAREGIK